jgi:hypothetical protein
MPGHRRAEDGLATRSTLSLFPPPLWGRVREGGEPQAQEFVIPPSPTLPHKGGESRLENAARYSFFISYTGNPFFCASSFSEVCGRAPMCWITSAAASAPSRPAAS